MRSDVLTGGKTVILKNLNLTTTKPVIIYNMFDWTADEGHNKARGMDEKSLNLWKNQGAALVKKMVGDGWNGICLEVPNPPALINRMEIMQEALNK